MITHIFIPALPRMTGGLAVLARLANCLEASGFSVCFVTSGGLPPGFTPEAVPCLPLDRAKPGRSDIWLVPEGFGNALAPGLQAKARCVVYVQNWAYLLSGLPAGVRWQQLPVYFLSVSQPVAWFTEWVTGRASSILRGGIDRALFCPDPERRGRAERGFPPGSGPVRIAWMPRKNRALAIQIRALMEARLPEAFPGLRLEWVEIHNMPQIKVADVFRSCAIFLATGFPEGLPLPPLEAMGCGAVPVGFSGLGGFDYMRQVPHAEAFIPWWPHESDFDMPGNGFFAADGDIPRAAICLEHAFARVCEGGPAAVALFDAGQRTADAHSLALFGENARALWQAAASWEIWG